MQQYLSAPGERVYAIGDVHGCWDLLAQMLGLIRADNDSRPPARTRVMLLGDVIDRGPATKPILDHLVRYTRASERFVVLMGNHEQLMWRALAGDPDALKGWLEVGGAETLKSFGVQEDLIANASPKQVLQDARRKVGPDVAVWLEGRPTVVTSGDLVFVHAGVRPGVLLAAQSVSDLLWIRSPFLESEEERPFLVIHGHSVTAEGPDVRSNRIGLDTGAYLTGRLTAMGFEGADRWTLTAS